MFTATARTRIARAPDAVFAYLVDPNNWPRWVEDVRRVDAPSPMAKGDAFEEVSVFRGEERRCRGEVVDLVPGRLVVLRLVEVFSGPELLPTRRFDLSVAGAGTEVVWTNEVETRGVVRVLGPVLPVLFRKKMAGYLEALKRELEAH
jgi:uncharacterized protein YndB with AHSA1/START domain